MTVHARETIDFVLSLLCLIIGSLGLVKYFVD